MIPWDKFADLYYKNFPSRRGAPTKDARMVLGVVISGATGIDVQEQVQQLPGSHRKHPPTDGRAVLHPVKYVLAHHGSFTRGTVQVRMNRLLRTDHHRYQHGQNRLEVESAALESFKLRKAFT